MIESRSWFYEINGEQKGPLLENELIELIKSNKLLGTNKVWREGFDDWVDIAHSELSGNLAKLPPAIPKNISLESKKEKQEISKVTNLFVWILAFAPIIGEFLRALILFATYKNEYRAIEAYANGKYWYITLVLTIFLCVMDEKKLLKSGIDTSKFRIWMIFVPVYLYQRAKILGDNFTYFIIWIVCFMLVLFGVV